MWRDLDIGMDPHFAEASLGPRRWLLMPHILRLRLELTCFGFSFPIPDGDIYSIYTMIWLVVWNMNFMTFHILGIIIPTDELIFFRGVGLKPPTSDVQ